MSLHSYQRVQNQTEDPRNAEYRLFALITKALMDAEKSDHTSLVKAIHRNRRLWLTLQADCAGEDNRLPEATRAGIISLALLSMHWALPSRPRAAPIRGASVSRT